MGLSKHLSRYVGREASTQRAMTLVELLIVMLLLGIAFGLAAPMMGDSKELRLRAAARMLAADFEFAQNESIAHPDDRRVVVFDTTNNDKYWIAPASDTSQANAITDIVRKEPFVVQFGTGRAASTYEVQIQSVSLGGDDEVRFDAYGSPDQSTDATVARFTEKSFPASVLHGTYSIP